MPPFDSLLPLLEVDDQQVLPVFVRDYVAVRERLNELVTALDRPFVAVVRTVVAQVGTELLLEGFEFRS